MCPITRQNFLRHEWIGLEVEIVDSTDPTLRGRKGKVIDETKNTLIIDTGRKTIRVPKNIVTLKFLLPDGEVVVEGKRIVMRPEERIKNLR